MLTYSKRKKIRQLEAKLENATRERDAARSSLEIIRENPDAASPESSNYLAPWNDVPATLKRIPF